MKTTTPDDDNDTIRAICDEVYPAPLGGFETEAEEFAHKTATEKLCNILIHRWPAAEIAAARTSLDNSQAQVGELMRQRDALREALAECLPFVLSDKLTSHKSFDRTEPHTRQSAGALARAALEGGAA